MRISDWSSDVCSSDLLCCLKEQVRIGCFEPRLPCQTGFGAEDTAHHGLERLIVEAFELVANPRKFGENCHGVLAELEDARAKTLISADMRRGPPEPVGLRQTGPAPGPRIGPALPPRPAPPSHHT